MVEKRKRATRFEGVIRSVSPRSWEELIALLTKIVGESVKDKAVRAIMVGVLGAAGNYAASVTEPEPPPPPPVVQQTLQNDKAPE